VPWARSGADFTLVFESFAMTLCKEMPINAVSRIVSEDDNKLWRMVRYYVEEARRFEDYSRVSSIGVDETSAKKGHDYVTLVVDLKKKKTIFVTKGKDASTLKEFKEDLIAHHGLPENITNASIDMSPAKYLRVLRTVFPKQRSQKETLKAIESMPRQNLKTVRALHIRENFQYITSGWQMRNSNLSARASTSS